MICSFSTVLRSNSRCWKCRHERGAASDLRRDGDVEGDRHRARRRRVAAAVDHGAEGRRPGRRPGDLPDAGLHRHLPRGRLPGLLRPLQVRVAAHTYQYLISPLRVKK